MEPDAAVGMRNRPDRPGVKSVFGLPLHPISHRVPDIVVAGPGRFSTNAWDNIAAIHPEAIAPGALFPDFIRDVKAPGRSGFSGNPDRPWCNKKGAISFHHVDHAILQRYLYTDITRVGWLVGSHPVVPWKRPGGGLSNSTAPGQQSGTGSSYYSNSPKSIDSHTGN